MYARTGYRIFALSGIWLGSLADRHCHRRFGPPALLCMFTQTVFVAVMMLLLDQNALVLGHYYHSAAFLEFASCAQESPDLGLPPTPDSPVFQSCSFFSCRLSLS